jgi:hypothetical protein
MHRHLPPEEADFAGFAPGAMSRVRELIEGLRSKLPDGWTVERIRAVTGDEHADLMPLLGAVRLPHSELTMTPRAIVSARGRFLFCDDGGDWYVGREDERHWFTCEEGPISDLDAAAARLTW